MAKVSGYVMMAVGTVLLFTPLAPIGVMLVMAGSLFLSYATQIDLDKALNSAMAQEHGLQGNTRNSQSTIIMVYGRQRIGANYLYAKASGANNEDVYLVMGLCEGEIDAIEGVYFNDHLVWRNGVTPNTPFKGKFVFDYRLGTSAQTSFSATQADFAVMDPDFTDRYPFTAVAYFKLTFDATVYQSLPTVSFVVRGLKVFDPRDAGTRWTQNGPLQWRDAMTNTRYAAAVSPSNIDDVAVIEAANYVDATVTRGIGLSVTGEVLGEGSGVLNRQSVSGFMSDNEATFDFAIPVVPISPGSVYCRGPHGQGPDNGSGVMNWYINVLVGPPIQWGHGTIDYDTGAVHFINDAPGNGSGSSTTGASWISGNRRFTGRLLNTPVTAGSVEITGRWNNWNVTANHFQEYTLPVVWYTETFTDDGAGNLTGDYGGSGTVNYTTGEVDITFKTAPAQGTFVLADYSQGASAGLMRYATNYFAVSGRPVIDEMQSLMAHFLGAMFLSGGKYKLLIQKVEASVMDLRSGGEEDVGNNIIDGSFSWRKGGMADTPYRLRAKWLDPAENYRVKDYVVDLSPALGGKIEITLELFGVTSLATLESLLYTQGNLVQRDIHAALKINQSGIALEPLNVVRITHPAAGWVNKKMRIVGIAENFQSEQYELELAEYDDSDFVVGATVTDIMTPAPTVWNDPSVAPPLITGLVLTEARRSLRDGTIASFIHVTFNNPVNYSMLAAVEIYSANSLNEAANAYVGETTNGVFEIGPVEEGYLYYVECVVRNVNGVRWFNRAMIESIMIAGKTAVPTTPSYVDALCSFTDRVVLNWGPIADRDLGNYELRTDLNWGNATNRLYLGKGTSFWMQAAAPTYTIYLKSIDTSGNYSTNYAMKTLTNGAPTGPTVTTDYLSRDCIVKWGASTDLDFLKWVLTIYSDAGRTTLKRTVEMQSPGFTYTYDQILADFGGAGAPGTIYFRIVTHDLFGSTATTDFSATQASPAISQYDGGSVERVRIGDLGSGAYGARFRDSGGNITFEQGDTLKQKHMKMDETHILKTVVPWTWPFADIGMAFGIQCFDGNVFIGKRDSNNNIYGAVLDSSFASMKALSILWNQTDTVYGLDSITMGSANVAISVSRNTGTTGLYRGLYDFNSATFTRAMTQVENDTTRSHYTPTTIKYDSAESGVFFVDRVPTTNVIYYFRQNDTTGAITSAIAAAYTCPVNGAFSIIGIALIALGGSTHDHQYRIFIRKDSTGIVYSYDFAIGTNVVSNAKTYSLVGTVDYPVCAVHIANETTSPIMVFICESAGFIDTFDIRDTNDVILLSIVSKYSWAINNPYKRIYSPRLNGSQGLGIGFIPYLGTMYDNSMFYPYKMIYTTLYKYEKLSNKNIQDTLATLIS